MCAAAETPSTDSNRGPWTMHGVVPHTPEIQSLHPLGGWETGRRGTVPFNVSIPCPATHLPASTGTPNDRGAARGHSRSAIPGYLPRPDKAPSSAHAGPLPPWDRFSNVPAAIHLHAGPSSDFCCTTGMEGKLKEGTEQGRSRGEPTLSPDLPCPAEYHISLTLLSSILGCRIVHLPAARGPGYCTVGDAWVRPEYFVFLASIR